MAEKRLKIGELLVAAGLISAEQLTTALTAQAQLGGTLGENFVRLGFVTVEAILEALSSQAGLQHINLARVKIPPETQKFIPEEVVRARWLLPIGLEGNRLVVAMVDPTDLAALKDVEFRTGRRTRPVILSRGQFAEALEFFGTHGYGVKPLALQEARGDQPGTEAGTERTIPSLLKRLIAWNGQDLHLSPGAIPAIRVDNELRRVRLPVLTPGEVEALVLGLLTPEQRDGLAGGQGLDFSCTVAGVGRFRCNIYRQHRGLAFTAHHVADVIPTAVELGLPGFLRGYALKSQGLILITGPIGHGKTTTLACLVDIINRERKANIITIEDPIEFAHQHKASNINQREVGSDTRSYAEGLRHIFHQNPDVIVVGDLLDHESFATALSAAETGHLVMGTMHSMNATAAIDRILDSFPAGQQPQIRAQLAESLQVVFSQRLVRRATGTGRVLAWERMSTSLRVRNAIRDGKVHLLRGMMQSNLEELVSIDSTLADLVAVETVTYEEALKYADNPSYLNDLLKVRSASR
jgi:twitching motility protein PilT